MAIRKSICLLVCLFIIVLSIAGCGEKSESPKEDSNTTVLSTIFKASDSTKYVDLVEKSDLSDEDKGAFKEFVKGSDPTKCDGKTIQEVIEFSKKEIADRKIAQEKQNAEKKLKSKVVLSAAYKCDSIFDDHLRSDRGYNVRIDYNIVNESGKTLQAIQLEYIFYNDFKEVIEKGKTDVTKLNVSPGQTESHSIWTLRGEGSKFAQQIADISTTDVKTEIKVVKAVYTDGTMESISE